MKGNDFLSEVPEEKLCTVNNVKKCTVKVKNMLLFFVFACSPGDSKEHGKEHTTFHLEKKTLVSQRK